MGIVLKQSFKNTLLIIVGFAIGAVNTIWFYPRFLQEEYYGLVTFLLSSSNLLMPLTAFGVQYTIIKFYAGYTDPKEQDRFLFTMLVMPLFIALPFAFIGNLFYEAISEWLSVENPIVKQYTFVIYLIAVATAYFEIFYAWSKVQLKSVFGNLLKEIFPRAVVFFLLIGFSAGLFSKTAFIYFLTAGYFVRVLLMMCYAFYLRKPVLRWQVPANLGAILKYTSYVILAGSAGTILLDIDKFMLPQHEAIAITAYYSVAIYIGSVVEMPGRAMSQIVNPITALAINQNDWKKIASLYKQISINLMLVSGWLFILINVNIRQLYAFMESTLHTENYTLGIPIVLMISLTKLYHMILGNNGAIISNSSHFRVLLPYGVLMALSVYFLNSYLIPTMGMNGAAFSTFIVVLVFNTLKLWFVKSTFKFSPFSHKSMLLAVVLIVFYAGFVTWDFNFNPWVNILCKSGIVTVLYFLVVYYLRISKDANELVTALFKKRREWF
ncbi:MAG: polysaccharide biosynthesis C-terminal domain-containing protein [Flavobacteriaceae bacterium]|nr:polysaccharide biosynthesis C-terminal domain-containing protein [Flavobacteriaceae bacterium]